MDKTAFRVFGLLKLSRYYDLAETLNDISDLVESTVLEPLSGHKTKKGRETLPVVFDQVAGYVRVYHASLEDRLRLCPAWFVLTEAELRCLQSTGKAVVPPHDNR